MSGRKSECSKCHEPVMFARTANGKHMPLDKARDLSGTSRHVAWRDTDLILHVRTLAQGEEPTPGVEHRHMPHFATCRERDRAAGQDEALR
ncbi:MAG: hypothetical protein ACRDOL_22560 [Streptosporangiaceae bacterium]